MRKQLTKTDAEFQMFSDFYKIYQDYYVPEENDDYWSELVYMAESFIKKYESEFAKNLMLAYLDSRDELFKLKNA